MRETLQWEDKGPRAHVPGPRWRRQQSTRSPVVWGRARLPSTLGTFLLHHNLFWAASPFPVCPRTPRSQTAVPWNLTLVTGRIRRCGNLGSEPSC